MQSSDGAHSSEQVTGELDLENIRQFSEQITDLLEVVLKAYLESEHSKGGHPESVRLLMALNRQVAIYISTNVDDTPTATTNLLKLLAYTRAQYRYAAAVNSRIEQLLEKQMLQMQSLCQPAAENEHPNFALPWAELDDKARHPAFHALVTQAAANIYVVRGNVGKVKWIHGQRNISGKMQLTRNDIEAAKARMNSNGTKPLPSNDHTKQRMIEFGFTKEILEAAAETLVVFHEAKIAEAETIDPAVDDWLESSW